MDDTFVLPAIPTPYSPRVSDLTIHNIFVKCGVGFPDKMLLSDPESQENLSVTVTLYLRKFIIDSNTLCTKIYQSQ